MDASGNAHLTGTTTSSDFPTTPGAWRRSLGGGSDAFVSEFNPTGSSLLFSTYLGGEVNSENGFGIAVDTSGNVYVAGSTDSIDFPRRLGLFRGPSGVAKMPS